MRLIEEPLNNLTINLAQCQYDTGCYAPSLMLLMKRILQKKSPVGTGLGEDMWESHDD